MMTEKDDSDQGAEGKGGAPPTLVLPDDWRCADIGRLYVFAWMYFPFDEEARKAYIVALIVARLGDPKDWAAHDPDTRRHLEDHLRALGGYRATSDAFRHPLALRATFAPDHVGGVEDQHAISGGMLAGEVLFHSILLGSLTMGRSFVAKELNKRPGAFGSSNESRLKTAWSRFKPVAPLWAARRPTREVEGHACGLDEFLTVARALAERAHKTRAKGAKRCLIEAGEALRIPDEYLTHGRRAEVTFDTPPRLIWRAIGRTQLVGCHRSEIF